MRLKDVSPPLLRAPLIALLVLMLAGCSGTLYQMQVPPLDPEIRRGPTPLIPLSQIEEEIRLRSMADPSPAKQ